MIVNVYPTVGVYLVAEMSRGTLHAYTVGKDKTCSCGTSNKCCHVRAVADHLMAGGEASAGEARGCFARLALICPCDDVQVDDRYWRCLHDSSHYWQWRGERFGVKNFLIRPHPAKMGAFYEQTSEERETFLAAAARRHDSYLIVLAAQREDRPRFAPNDSGRKWL